MASTIVDFDRKRRDQVTPMKLQIIGTVYTGTVTMSCIFIVCVNRMSEYNMYDVIVEISNPQIMQD